MVHYLTSERFLSISIEDAPSLGRYLGQWYSVFKLFHLLEDALNYRFWFSWLFTDILFRMFNLGSGYSSNGLIRFFCCDFFGLYLVQERRFNICFNWFSPFLPVCDLTCLSQLVVIPFLSYLILWRLFFMRLSWMLVVVLRHHSDSLIGCERSDRNIASWGR